MMQHLEVNDLSIYSFQQNKIIMMDKITKNMYQYFQTPIFSVKQNHIIHNSLLSAIVIPTGLLYKKSIMTLQSQLHKRIKIQNKQPVYFEQQQIINTFLPILQCLQYLHHKNIIHQNVTTQNIQFNQQGQVLLKDWLLEIPNNPYYQNQNIKQRSTNQDIIALGNIILEVITLTKFKHIKHNDALLQKNIKKVIYKYSRGIIIGILVMVRKIDKYFQHLNKILQNNEEFIDKNSQLINMYKKLKFSQKQLKTTIPNLSLSNGININKNIQILSTTHNNIVNNNIIKSPILIKKTQKVQDSQNKKHFTQNTLQYQKKNNQRIHKISQKNINYQVAKKQDMALKKMSNYKFNFNLDKQIVQKSFKNKNKDKQQNIKFGSPIKRLRTIPKKKNT